MLHVVVYRFVNRILPGLVSHAKEVLRFLVIVLDDDAVLLSPNIGRRTVPRENPDKPVRTESRCNIFLDASSGEVSSIFSLLHHH